MTKPMTNESCADLKVTEQRSASRHEIQQRAESTARELERFKLDTTAGGQRDSGNAFTKGEQ